VPKEIGQLTQLTELHLFDNQLTALPKEIGQLTQLKQLTLSNNPNLLLSTEQKEWISKLIENGCNVEQ